MVGALPKVRPSGTEIKFLAQHLVLQRGYVRFHVELRTSQANPHGANYESAHAGILPRLYKGNMLLDGRLRVELLLHSNRRYTNFCPCVHNSLKLHTLYYHVNGKTFILIGRICPIGAGYTRGPPIWLQGMSCDSISVWLLTTFRPLSSMGCNAAQVPLPGTY